MGARSDALHGTLPNGLKESALSEAEVAAARRISAWAADDDVVKEFDVDGFSGLAEESGDLHVRSTRGAPVRYGDHAKDLWTTFNLVQEHLCRGGVRYAGHVPAAAGAVFPTHFVRNTTRPVVSLMEGQKLNKGLWQLAEEFSRN